MNRKSALISLIASVVLFILMNFLSGVAKTPNVEFIPQYDGSLIVQFERVEISPKWAEQDQIALGQSDNTLIGTVALLYSTQGVLERINIESERDGYKYIRIELSSTNGLVEGHYENAERLSSKSPNSFDIGANGLGCNTLKADFTIVELPNANNNELVIDFEVDCDSNGDSSSGVWSLYLARFELPELQTTE